MLRIEVIDYRLPSTIRIFVSIQEYLWRCHNNLMTYVLRLCKHQYENEGIDYTKTLRNQSVGLKVFVVAPLDTTYIYR